VVEVDENDQGVFELSLPDTQWSYRAFKFDREADGTRIYSR
jgi:hypothetical protein